jgi:hypothetical protein
MKFNEWLNNKYKYRISPLNSAQLEAVEAYLREVKVVAQPEIKEVVAPKPEPIKEEPKAIPIEQLLKNKVVK